MYRERHSFDCLTNNHACMAGPIDDQIAELFKSLTIPDDWRERIAVLAAKRGARRVDVASLQEQRRRLVRAYGDGGFSDAEYEERLADLDLQLRTVQPAPILRAEACIGLIGDLSAMWTEATGEERSRLLAPLIQRVYVDIETKRVCAITAAPGFDLLIGGVLAASGQPACVLLPAEAAGRPECWTWWRRGRIELPVQVVNALSMLQAYPAS